MRNMMKVTAAAALAGGMLLATGGVAAAQNTHDPSLCVSDREVGKWVDGPGPIGGANRIDITNDYDASQHFKNGARITAKYDHRGVYEVWEERWIPTNKPHIVIEMSRLVKCAEPEVREVNPPAGGVAASAIRVGYGGGPVWASYTLRSGTVTVGDPEGVSNEEP